MADDIQVLLNGATRKFATQDIGAPGAERQVFIQKLLQGQEASPLTLDKLFGSLIGVTDSGIAIMGRVRDHVPAPLVGIVEDSYSPPILDPSSRLHILGDGLRKRFKDEFSGATVDATKWNVTPFGAGSATVAGSVLTLSTGGGTSGDGVELISVDTYDSPVRLLAIINSISQRVANQEFSIELVEETTVAGAAGTDGAKILFNGATNTVQQVTTLCTGDQDGPNNWTTQATSSATKYEIDLMPDEVWFYGISTLNSTGTRSWYAHQDRKTPDASKRYRIRIRLRNTGAASLTTVAIDAITLEDNTYVPVELAHARGSATGGEGQAVNLSGGGGITIVLGVGDKSQWFDETAAALGGAATFTGTSRDLTGQATGGSSTTFPGTFRALALQDAAGTLYVEGSHDGATWQRIRGVALTQFDATCRFQARIEEPQIARFYRAVLVNGAGAAGVTRVFTKIGAMTGT